MGLIRRDAGIGGGRPRRRYDDLDALAGTWSAEDFDGFAAVQADFDHIDGALWE